MSKSSKGLSIIPLGGIGEIGKNMMVFEYGDDIIVVDAGVAFPGEDLLGIDLVIPDTSYLIENKQKIRGFFITHGHEDHIGALPYILKDFDVPVYGTRLTIGLIKKKITESGFNANLIEISTDEIVNAGVFKIEFFRINHSIPDGVGLAIDTPEGVVVHSGDFKLDQTPIDNRVTELYKLIDYSRRGVLALICDSTGVEKEGYTPSEKVVGESFNREFEMAKGRIIVATFASNVHRIQQVVNAALEHDRRIAVVGRSMINVVEAARELGYLSCPESTLIELDEISRYAPHQIVIITTGSQGEPMAALTRISNSSHRQISLEPGDTIIISATPIPGNSKHVYRTINNLFKGGARVIYSDVASVHVSGHAAQEEIKTLINMVKPKYAIPFHGEYRHLVKFRKTASELGIPEANVLISSIGERMVFHRKKASRQGRVQSGSVLIDGLGVGDVGNIVLRDRKHLSEDGIVIVVLTIDKASGAVVAGPDVVSRGFIYIRESEELMTKMKHQMELVVRRCEKEHIRDWNTIKNRIRRAMDNVMYSETRRKPVVIPVIMEV